MSSRAKKKRSNQQNALENKLSIELKTFSPLTKNQELVFRNFSRKHLFLHGLAGTGKSFIAIYLALKEIFSSQTPYKKLIIVRSVVQTRDMGHLPGSDKDKMKAFEAPYMSICRAPGTRRCLLRVEAEGYRGLHVNFLHSWYYPQRCHCTGG